MQTIPTRRAFTLIEISIVIVVIGLIVGGMIVGDQMINQARLMSIVSEKEKMEAAVLQFKDKYKALPGDMYNATSFWGTYGTCPRGSVPTTTATTCNGNGNGKIALSKDKTIDDSGGNFTGDMVEAHRAWQHLGLAGLVAGKYNGGMETSDTIVTTPNVRVPNASFSESTGWHIYYVGPRNGDANFFDGDYGHILYMGRGAYDVTVVSKTALTVADVENIDSKVDDGKASSGRIRAGTNANPLFGGACISASTLNYDLTTTTTPCIPMFLTQIQ